MRLSILFQTPSGIPPRVRLLSRARWVVPMSCAMRFSGTLSKGYVSGSSSISDMCISRPPSAGFPIVEWGVSDGAYGRRRCAVALSARSPGLCPYRPVRVTAPGPGGLFSSCACNHPQRTRGEWKVCGRDGRTASKYNFHMSSQASCIVEPWPVQPMRRHHQEPFQ